MKVLKQLLSEMAMGRRRDPGPYDDAPRGYSIGNPVRATELVAGMSVAATYNKYNHGTDFIKVLGFNTTNDDKVQYRSVRELFRATGTRSLDELSDRHEAHMVAQEILEDGRLGDRGGWYYPFEGRWARGSGAEPLSFRMLTKESDATKRSDRGISGQNVVFTGFRDPQLAQRVQAAGGRMQDNVTRQTTLVVGLTPNSESGKAHKARQVGADVISRQDLEAMLSQRGPRQEWDRFANESVQLREWSAEDGGDVASRLEEIKDNIKELANEALQIIRQSGNRMAYERSRAYWYPHVVGALDKEHDYLGGSMTTMQNVIDEIRQADEDHDENIGNDDEDHLDRVEQDRQRRLRKGTY